MHNNLSRQDLIDFALKNHEAVLASNGALTVTTGKRTGRSPKDRFIVKDSITEKTVSWGNINQAIEPETFNALWSRVETYIQNREHFTGDYHVGATNKRGINARVITEKAWMQLFAMNLFIPAAGQHDDSNEDWTVMNAPGFLTDPTRDGVNSDAAIMLNFSARKILICGVLYAGEMKKSLFSVLNFLLPELGILPMHCSANVGTNDEVTVFFGLSGTGKTTLSADPEKYLIGDDEHGWGDTGVFNFEGGCYAKCIDLSEKNEPSIWAAIRKGAIMENVILDQNGVPDFSNKSLTENTRAAYPREHIDMRTEKNEGGQPSAIIFLTCDLYGVLPPVAKLSIEQAAYYFLSGYTARMGGTETGANVEPVFSTCFGAPFFPRPAQVYADLLMSHLAKHNCPVYLVNTGWTGGALGKGGKRFSIPTTRAVVHAIQNHSIEKGSFETLPGFNFKIPTALEGVDAMLLDPRKGWSSPAAYQAQANILISQFNENFKKYDHAKAAAAGPILNLL
jgi:phosphoenolpyruvate carboxykinase (ATP)